MYLAPDTKLLHSEQPKSLVQCLALCPSKLFGIAVLHLSLR